MDVNNLKDDKRKKDHMYSDILGGTGNGGKVSNTNGKSQAVNKKQS